MLVAQTYGQPRFASASSQALLSLFKHTLSLFLLVVLVGAPTVPYRTLASGPVSVSITLAWDAAQGTDIVGYNVYFGTASGNYSSVTNAPTNLAVITGLVPGTRYFFTTTTVNSQGMESARAPEISFVAGSSLPPALLSVSLSPTRQLNLSGTAPAGYTYQVLTSQDLRNWSLAGTITTDPTGTFRYTYPAPTTGASRLYRLRQLVP